MPTLMKSNRTPTLVVVGSEDDTVVGLHQAFSPTSQYPALDIVVIVDADQLLRHGVAALAIF